MSLVLLLAEITLLAGLSRVSLDPVFNSFHYHITPFHCWNVSITIKKRLKLNKMLLILVMFCNFMSCNFMPCKLVRQFHVCHFQRPHIYSYTYEL